MKFGKGISILVLLIAALALIATAFGIFSKEGPGQFYFTSIYGQTITIYGKGIYGNNSVTAALQAIPQDIVTLVLGIPLLLFSFFIKGKLLLSGTLGYFGFLSIVSLFRIFRNINEPLTKAHMDKE